MARRPSRTPVIVAPVVMPARFAVKRARTKQAATKDKAKLDRDFERLVDRAYDQVRREHGVPVGPGKVASITERLTAEQKTARAIELAKQSSWRYQNRKWLVAVVWAAPLALSRGLAHVTPMPATEVTLVDVGLTFLAIFLMFLGKVGRQLAVATVILGLLVAASASQYLPLVGFGVLGVLLVLAGIWYFKVGRNPMPEFQGRVKKIRHDRLRGFVASLTTPRAGVAFTVLAAGLWWMEPIPTKPACWLFALGLVTVIGIRMLRFRVREVIEPTQVVLGREIDWANHVATREGAKGSVMVGTEDVRSPRDDTVIGWAAGIEFAKGGKGASEVVNSLRTYVATTYGVGPRDILWEANPKNDREARLVVLDAPNGNATDEAQIFSGDTDFDPGTGVVTHGIRADWTEGQLQLFRPNFGAFHGHFSGGTGSGKTSGLDTAMRLFTQSNVVVPVIIDLGGCEFVTWEQHVPLFVGKREDGDEDLSALTALQVLMNINALVQHRQKKLGRLKREDSSIKAYPVDEGHPVIWPIFDEWQFAITNFKYKPSHTALAAKYTPGGDRQTISQAILQETKLGLTQARKAMIPIWLAGQSMGLTAGFGNLSEVRNQCAQGNMVAYRNTAESGQQAFGGGLSVDPSTIPGDVNGKGLCFMSSPAGARDAMVRTFYSPTPTDHDHRIAIPDIPDDELAILRRGLDDRGELIVPGSRKAAEETAVHIPVNRPDLKSVPDPEPEVPAQPTGRVSDELKDSMVEWAVQQERPVRRSEFVVEFTTVRGKASRKKIDDALADLKDEGRMQADATGVYTVKEVAA